ncbi:hypothetical protein [Ideonella sp. BN130291]|uniref:hypothetical protein n=1 Tax=Ideonella sp. BN130291 TaxID=3112940 RepID=UPI002E26D896|nr:hypothetical protein [Ideonella sp. BN130291]
MKTLVGAVLAWALVSAAGPACADAPSALAVRLPADDRVVFRGMVSFDQAGTGAGAMLYPAPNVAGLLVAVLTHGAVMEATKNQEKARLQEAADKVLQPYQPVLSVLGYRELLQRALAEAASAAAFRPAEPGSMPDSDWIDMAPVYAMTQDQRAIVLDNVVAFYAAGNSKTPRYQNTIRVVSRARTEDDPQTHWSAVNGEQIRTETAFLLRESLRIAAADAQRNAAVAEAPQKTYRYPEGSAERIERAGLVGESCGRLVLRTLRGWMLSVPKRGADSAACTPDAPSVAQSAPTAQAAQ